MTRFCQWNDWSVV